MNNDNLQKIVKIRDTAAQDVAVDNSPRLRKRRYYLMGGGAAVVLLAALSFPALHRWAKAEASVSMDQVRLAKVTRGTFVRDVSVDGQIVAAVNPTRSKNRTVTVLRASPGDAAAGSIGAPHARQNRAISGFTCPHAAHAAITAA